MVENTIKIIGNLELNSEENMVIVTVNPKMYDRKIVYAAAYTFLDKVFVVLEGDPEDEILVELRPKEKVDLEELGRDFNNELINYAVYYSQLDKNQFIRDTIIQKATSNMGVSNEYDTCDPNTLEDDSVSNTDYEVEGNFEDDPLGIAKPWDEEWLKMGNVEIDKENNEVKLYLNSEYYDFNLIMEASKDFSDNFWVRVDGDIDNKIIIGLKSKSEKIDLKELGYEFSNYVLGLMQNAEWKKTL